MKKPATSIQKAVMGEISNGHVRMHSRLYFSLLTAVMTLVGLAGGFLFAYVVSIATYAIRIQAATTPAYGARDNLADALGSFPWWLLVLAVAFVALALWLMRRYGRAYRHTLVSIITIVLLVSTALGIGFSFAGIGGSHDDNQNMRGRSSSINR